MKKTAYRKLHPRFATILSFLLSAAIFLGLTPMQSQAANSPILAADENFLAEINEERAALGLSPMVWNDNLMNAAAVRAMELPRRMSHTRPNGTPWYTVDDDLIYGENLCRVTKRNGYPTADYITSLWMDSASHRAILLDPRIVSVGVAVYTGGDGRYYYAAEFGFPNVV